MPIREYQGMRPDQGCDQCRMPFERLERMQEQALTVCPACGQPVDRLISAPSVGASQSGLDHRAQSGGFHKLKRLGRGEYEKVY